MIYEISNSNAEIDFAPDEKSEIIQNVRTILNTIQGTVPLDRNFGVNPEYLDAPLNEITKTLLAAQIAGQISEYENRATLRKINVDADLTGNFRITALVEV